MAKKPDDLPYRPCVGVMLLNREGLVWIGRRISKWDGDASSTMWQMPQGGIDKGETPPEAARRELAEEVGTDRATIVAESEDWFTYDLPAEALGIALKGKYRGQKQKWFAMMFEGDDADIDIAPEAGEKPEFDQWRWAEIETLVDLVVPFKRDVYRQVVDCFAPIVANLRRAGS